MRTDLMSNTDQLNIKGRDKLISELGYWPDFCDAKICELFFRRATEAGLELSLTLQYIDMELNRELFIKLYFHGVLSMKLDNITIDNVIDKLSISDSLVIDIEAATGIFGHFKCKAIDVDIITSKPYAGQPE